MTLSPNHRLVWAGLDRVAWDSIGSQSALQHEFCTPQRSPEGLLGLQEPSQAHLLVCVCCGPGTAPGLHL